MALTFWGKSRVPKEVHPHESPVIMTIPLIVLAILSVVGGFIGVPHLIGEYLGHIPNYWAEWLAPVIKTLPEAAAPHTATQEWALMTTSVTLALISAFVAYRIYTSGKGTNEAIAKAFGPVYNVVNNKYFVDEA